MFVWCIPLSECGDKEEKDSSNTQLRTEQKGAPLVFLHELQVTLNLAMETQFVIHTPLMWLDKADVWALSDRLGVFDLVRRETLTCYNGIPGDGCGHCPACHLRHEGLERYLARP